MTEIAKIVKQRLQTNTRFADHPEANLLNAFVEQSLAEREQVEILQHLSQCANCREIVAISAAQPDIADAFTRAPARAGWLSWPTLRWVAAAACVVVIGAAITIHQKNESERHSAMQVSVSSDAIVHQVAPSQSPDLNPAPVEAAKQRPNRKTSRNRRLADATPFEIADASPLPEIVPGRAKADVAGPEGAERTVGGLAANNDDTAGSATFFPDDLATANLGPRWSLSWDGVLQRSLDSGRTWQTVPVATHLILRALAANGLDIWVGGKAGALFHSSDAGQHWAQVIPIANGHAFIGDIVGVEFSDGLHGKLTSSNREIWITSDAGQTWQKQ